MRRTNHWLLLKASTTALALAGGAGFTSAAWADATAECNVGTAPGAVNSTECGAGALANAPNSTAVGGAQAIGNDSTAVGQGAGATGENSTAVGASSQANGNQSTAVGRGAKADGLAASAFGFDAEARSDNSVAFGTETKALASGTIAFGFGAEAGDDAIVALDDQRGLNAAAFGFAAKARAAGSLALGANAETLSEITNAVALGAGSIASESNTVSVGDKGNNLLRRITNVMNGADVNDVATVGQLDKVKADLDLAILNSNPFLKFGISTKAKPVTTGFDSIAIGPAASAKGASSIAIGSNAQAEATQDSTTANIPHSAPPISPICKSRWPI